MGQMKMRRSPLCFTPAIEDRGGATTREAIRRRFGDTVNRF
jgi:hypothetical protein